MQHSSSAQVDEPWLVQEVIDYHRRTLPHQSSDYVLVRVEK